MTTLGDFTDTAVFMKEQCGHSIRTLARRMGYETSHVQVQRILGAAENMTLKTFLRFADACDFDVHIYVTPRRSRGKNKRQEAEVRSRQT